MRWLILFLFFSWFASSTALAQSYLDLVTLNQRISPGNKVKAVASDDVSDQTLTLSETNFGVRLPLKMPFGKAEGKGDFLLLNLSGNRTVLDADGGIQYPVFWQTTLPIGYQRWFSPKWTGLVMALPRISSDMEDLSGEDVLMGGLVLMTKTVNERLKYKVGAYANRELYGTMYLPLFGLDWRPNDRWEIFGVLPVNATILRKFNKTVWGGVHFFANVTTFRYSEALGSPYLHRNTNELYGFADLNLTSNLVVRGMAGFSVLRSYRQFADGDNLDGTLSLVKFGGPRTQLNDDFSDGAIFQLSFIYRYHLKD